MSWIDEAIKTIKEKAKQEKIAEKAKDFLKQHRREIEELGKNVFQDILVDNSLGDIEEAIKTHLIWKKSPAELIESVGDSAKIFDDARKEMKAEKRRIANMWRSLTKEASRLILPAIIHSL